MPTTDPTKLRDFYEIADEVLVGNFWPMDLRPFARMDWTEEKQAKHARAEAAIAAIQRVALSKTTDGMTDAEKAIWTAFQPVLKAIEEDQANERAEAAAEDAEYERLNRKYGVDRMHVHDLDYTVGAQDEAES